MFRKNNNRNKKVEENIQTFQKAEKNQSFEYVDDYLDDDEELDGANRAIRYSIKCLEMTRKVAVDNSSFMSKIDIAVRVSSVGANNSSLLSRASNLMARKSENKSRVELAQP